MKRYLLIIAALAVSISSLMAQTLPSLGNCNVKVVGQNLENYLVGHLNHSNADATTVSALESKTNKIVSAFLRMDADIYAMVELEQADTALIYLTKALNESAGGNVYAYVQDNITDCNSNSTGYGSIMAGFIYKKATIETVGSPQAMASDNTYGPRMQAQVFKHKATNEMFVLSMNHFKASSGSSNVQKRRENAETLISNLSRVTSTDPDVLIMGDLNCVTSESAIQYLINSGYTEILESYDASAYSYIYQGNYELIDHALANNTMAAQVTGAGVYHVNNGGSSSQKYSDHDAVMVGLNLGGGSVTPSDPDTTVTPDPEEPQGNYCLDTIFDFTTQGIGQFIAESLTDDNTAWAMNRTAKYGIQVDASRTSTNQDDYLVSPEIDLSGMTSASISINHCVYKGSVDEDRQELLATSQYTGNAETTVWTKIDITSYSTVGGAYVVSEQTVPQDLLSQGFRFALHYTGKGDQWEVKSAEVKAVCGGTATEALEAQTQVAVKVIRDGQIYILRDGFTYTITGVRVQ